MKAWIAFSGFGFKKPEVFLMKIVLFISYYFFQNPLQYSLGRKIWKNNLSLWK